MTLSNEESKEDSKRDQNLIDTLFDTKESRTDTIEITDAKPIMTESLPPKIKKKKQKCKKVEIKSPS